MSAFEQSTENDGLDAQPQLLSGATGGIALSLRLALLLAVGHFTLMQNNNREGSLRFLRTPGPKSRNEMLALSAYHNGLEDEHSKPQRYSRVSGQLGILIVAASSCCELERALSVLMTGHTGLVNR